MTRFVYAAIDVQGNDVNDRIEAETEYAARRELLLANLDVRSIEPYKSWLHRDIGKGKRVKPVEILHFSRQMAAFLRAGLTVVDGLDVISRSTANPTLAKALIDIRDQVRQGGQFEEALASHQDLLPRYYLGVVKSASMTGRLDEALEQLSSYMERELEARSRIKAALAYPMVIVGMSIVSVVVLTVYVLPKFVDLFDQLGSDLPWSTRSLMSLARFSQQYWWVYLLAFAGFAGVVTWTRRSRVGRRLADHLFIRLPVIGEIILFSGVERVCRILSALWQAGVPVTDGMAAAIESADNAVFVEKLIPVQEAVLAGEGISGPLADSGLFPDAAVQMLKVGEASGTMAEQLENTANFYGREVEVKLRKLTSYFEPAVIIAVGFVVGFVAIALVQAMYGSLSGGATAP
ncbi:MAG: type II secretion system F family protein [Actinobacteria bacterium]|nr:type II secretion system F family protein [Actinomycetota bacterium]